MSSNPAGISGGPTACTPFAIPRVMVACVLASITPACSESNSAQTWSDLFMVRPSVVLSTEALHSFDRLDPDENGLPGQSGQVVSATAHQVSLSGLRAGRLERGSKPHDVAVLARYARDLGATFPRPRVVDETPYWGKGLPFFQIAAPASRRTFVASNLFYPILIYDDSRALVDSLTRPPPSWREARRPQPSEFANVGEGAEDRRRARGQYLRNLTMITGLAVIADSVLLVNHGTGAREVDARLEVLPLVVDVYVNGARVAVDLPSPGQIFAHSSGSVFFVGQGRRGSELTEYVWKNER